MIQKLKFQVQDLSCVRSISNLMTSELESPMIFYLVYKVSASKRKNFVFPHAFQFLNSKC